jgi:hypothetical protein
MTIMLTIKANQRQILDSIMRRFSSVAQYAHEKVEGSPRDGHGRSQLCSSSTISTVGYGRLAKGRAVCNLLVILGTFLLCLQAV